MELKEAKKIAAAIRIHRHRHRHDRTSDDPPTRSDSAVIILDARISELEGQRDDLVAVCRAAVTFPAEYRKHLILFHAIEDKIK